MSIIELLIGVVVGLIVVAGAVKLMMDTLGSNRRLLLETRVNQDLRAAADLIVRDVRRSGYWTNAVSGVFTSTGSGTVVTNPHRDFYTVGEDTTGLKCPSPNLACYDYARDANDEVNDPERAGLKLTSGAIEFKNGEGNWQALNDPKVVTITTLTISPLATPRLIELYTYCTCLTKLTCDASDFQSGGTYYDPVDPTDPATPKRPTLSVRQYDIVLRGQSVADPTVVREIRESVRVRNDRMDGSCPAV